MTKIDIEVEKEVSKYKVELYSASGDLSLPQGLGPLTRHEFFFFSFKFLQSSLSLCLLTLNRQKNQWKEERKRNEQKPESSAFSEADVSLT